MLERSTISRTRSGVDRDRLRPVEEDLDGVTGRLQVGQETEDVLVPTGGLDPGGDMIHAVTNGPSPTVRGFFFQ